MRKTNILVVDTNLNTHDALVQSVREVYPTDKVHDFFDPLLALKYGAYSDVELLITSVQMRGADGPHLTRLLRQKHPDLRVVFVSANPVWQKWNLDSMPDAVLQVPATAASLRKAEEEWQRNVTCR